jgi:hypothetical protein
MGSGGAGSVKTETNTKWGWTVGSYGKPEYAAENWTVSVNATGDLNCTMMVRPYWCSYSDNHNLYIEVWIDTVSYSVSGEQVLDSSGTAAFLVTDTSNPNYTIQ